MAGAGTFRSIARQGVAVITYHGLLPEGYSPMDPGFDGRLITAAAFRHQLRLLRTRYNVISPEEMQAWARGEQELPARAALLTCDDGLLSNLTDMLPILLEEGLRCLFFITGGSLGDQRAMLWYDELLLMLLRARAGEFALSCESVDFVGALEEPQQRRALWWTAVKQLSSIDADQRERFLRAAHSYFDLEPAVQFYRRSYSLAERHCCLMTADEIRQLAAAGMTIGAHTMTHPILSQMPPNLAWHEIVNCKMRLESVLDKEVWAFSYPFGDPASVSPSIFTMARRAGFEMSFLNVGGGLGASLPLHAIPRIHVSTGMTLGEFEAHVSGFYELLRRIFSPAPRDISPVPDPMPAAQIANLPRA
jgi:peptidoglycan/xylan/chitin deacetylase (PgdA/CDA1 family)